MNWIIDYAFEMLESFIILQVAARSACSGNFLMNKLPSSPNRSFTELQQQKNLRPSHQWYLELFKGRSKKTGIVVLYGHDRVQVSTNQLHPTHCPSWFIGKFSHTCFHHTPKAANEMLETVTEKKFYNDDCYNNTCDDDNFGRPATENA